MGKKSLPEGQIKLEETLLSSVPLQQLSFRSLVGLFELTRRSLRGLNLDVYVALELQRYKDTDRCCALGAEVPGHCQEKLAQTLIEC